MDLISQLISEGWLKSPRLIKAFKKIKRVDFLPKELKHLEKLNEALPIGFGQTISQPLVVAFMLELLAPKKGNKILDIGSGSGWTTALLSEMVGEKGKVIALEVILELKKFGQENVEKYNFVKKGIAKFISADGTKGYQKFSPYDRILVSAEAKKFYPAWKKQLKLGGRIVFPMAGSIYLFIKKGKNNYQSFNYPGFAFVPLIEKKN